MIKFVLKTVFMSSTVLYL